MVYGQVDAATRGHSTVTIWVNDVIAVFGMNKQKKERAYWRGTLDRYSRYSIHTLLILERTNKSKRIIETDR